MWQLLARLDAQQLKALSACSTFYDLPHADAPEGEGLPAAAVEAMLQVRWFTEILGLLRECRSADMSSGNCRQIT